MKNRLLHNERYSQIKQKRKREFVPNKPEVDSMNVAASKLSEIDMDGGYDTFVEPLDIKFPINGIDESSSVNVIVYADQNAEQYFRYCEPTFVNWCNNKNYTLSIIREEYTLNTHISWNKIKLLRDSLHNGTFDIVVVVDADVIINNPFLDIKQYIKPNKHIYMSTDGENGSSLVNSGFIFTINNEYSKQFIDVVWKERHGEYSFKYFHEQTVISLLYNNGYFDIIELLDMRAVNSFWADDKYNMPTNNVYHFMGRSLEDKIKYAKNHFNIQD